MNLKHILTTASLALMPLAASAATLVIPAAGTGPGANQSNWKSELTLHNLGSRDVTVGLIFHDQNGGLQRVTPVPLVLEKRTTTVIDDIVKTRFARTEGTGAISIEVANADLRKIAVTSRTYNESPSGEFGQGIPAVDIADAATAGDTGVINGPSSATEYRFNFGLFSNAATTVRWELVRKNGEIAATKEVTYMDGEHRQYANGIVTLLGAEARDGDAIHAAVTRGSAIFYGSAVNQLTGDPNYIPGIRSRDEIRIDFIGIDLDRNGTAELLDADHDGVVDTRLELVSMGFPYQFRLIAKGENGEAVTFELIDAPADVTLFDSNGTIAWGPDARLKGTDGELKVRATAGGSSEILTIPVSYR